MTPVFKEALYTHDSILKREEKSHPVPTEKATVVGSFCFLAEEFLCTGQQVHAIPHRAWFSFS
jgi:hypothetical protein